jgi:hypothetical protein
MGKQMRDLWVAIEGGWRAGLSQFRRLRMLQRVAATMPDPLHDETVS